MYIMTNLIYNGIDVCEGTQLWNIEYRESATIVDIDWRECVYYVMYDKPADDSNLPEKYTVDELIDTFNIVKIATRWRT